MTGAAVWAVLAAALLALPAGLDRPAWRTVPAGPGARAHPRRPMVGLAIAVGALGGACLAVFGPQSGLLAAAVLCPSAALGLRVLQRRPQRLRIDRSLALTLDLTAAALHAGRPLADALIGAAPAAGAPVREALLRVAGLLRLGADPEQAWAVITPGGPLGPVAVAAVRSASSGSRLAVAFERLAAETRAEIVTASAARAQRAGVLSMAPLGACFLPSFVCLGVVPVVVGIARSALGVLP